LEEFVNAWMKILDCYKHALAEEEMSSEFKLPELLSKMMTLLIEEDRKR
jgi:hypothetical protein